jgi:small basic protein
VLSDAVSLHQRRTSHISVSDFFQPTLMVAVVAAFDAVIGASEVRL